MGYTAHFFRMTLGTCVRCGQVMLLFVIVCLSIASADDVYFGRRPTSSNDFHRDWDTEFASAKRRFDIGGQIIIIIMCIIGAVMFFLLCYHCCRRRQVLSNPGVIVHGAPAGSVIPSQGPAILPTQPPAAGFVPSPYQAPYPPPSSPYQSPPYPTAYSPSVNVSDQPSAPLPASPPPPYSQAVASPFFEPQKIPSYS